jgi:hypothetical protein
MIWLLNQPPNARDTITSKISGRIRPVMRSLRNLSNELAAHEFVVRPEDIVCRKSRDRPMGKKHHPPHAMIQGLPAFRPFTTRAHFQVVDIRQP